MTAQNAVLMSGITPMRGRRIFSGECAPQRDELNRISIGMALDASEANELMAAAGLERLDPSRGRDALIAQGLDSGRSLQRTNEELARLGEDAVR